MTLSLEPAICQWPELSWKDIVDPVEMEGCGGGIVIGHSLSRSRCEEDSKVFFLEGCYEHHFLLLMAYGKGVFNLHVKIFDDSHSLFS